MIFLAYPDLCPTCLQFNDLLVNENKKAVCFKAIFPDTTTITMNSGETLIKKKK